MIDPHTFEVKWSEDDGEWVGLAEGFPSLSWLAKTPDRALAGIRQLVGDIQRDPDLSEGASSLDAMTETPETGETSDQADTAALSVTRVSDVYRAPNPDLASLAGVADGIGVGVTLYLPWGVACGVTTGRRPYYEHLAQVVRGTEVTLSEGDEDLRTWSSLIDEFVTADYDEMANLTAEEAAERRFAIEGWDLIAHIRLRDVRCYVPSFATPLRHNFLSLRLTDVSAWSFGTFPE